MESTILEHPTLSKESNEEESSSRASTPTDEISIEEETVEEVSKALLVTNEEAEEEDPSPSPSPPPAEIGTEDPVDVSTMENGDPVMPSVGHVLEKDPTKVSTLEAEEDPTGTPQPEASNGDQVDLSELSTTETDEIPTEEETSPSSSSSWIGDTIDTVKTTAIGQYEHFKTAHPDVARKIAGAVEDVAGKVGDIVGDIQLQHKERSDMDELNKAMERLEHDLQSVQKVAWDDYKKYWPLSNKHIEDDFQASQIAIKVAMVTAQASIAAAKKNAIESLEQSMEAAIVTREIKLETEYESALQEAQKHNDNLKRVGGDASLKASAKVESGIQNAQTKVQTTLSKSITSYEDALGKVMTDLEAVIGEEIKKLERTETTNTVEDDNNQKVVIAAVKANSKSKGVFENAKNVTLDVANKALTAVHGRPDVLDKTTTKTTTTTTTVVSTIQSDLEEDYEDVKEMVTEYISQLKAVSLAKAEDFETTVRGHNTRLKAVKKSMMIEYQKTLERVTADLKALSSA